MSSISIKIYLHLDKRIKNSPPWLKAVFKGFWLGVLNRRELRIIDRNYYEQTNDYCDESYNKSGFLDWERKALLKFFQSSQNILVAAIGGGREIVALAQLGFDVDGFECNRQLFEFAEKLFRKENIEGEFHIAPPDKVWHFGRIYDGAIIGWGAYMLIQGRAARIDFLRKMRVQMSAGAPLLVSFFARNANEIYFERVRSVANLIRTVLFREKIELGDDLIPEYAHQFIEQEIVSEFAEAGFKLVHYSTKEYGHAVGIAA